MLWLLLLVWKPVYYLIMMVMHSLHPTSDKADDYVGKIGAWFKDLFGLVTPTNL